MLRVLQNHPGPTDKLRPPHSLSSPLPDRAPFRLTQNTASDGLKRQPHRFPDLRAHLVIEVRRPWLSHGRCRKRIRRCWHVNCVPRTGVCVATPPPRRPLQPKTHQSYELTYAQIKEILTLKGRMKLQENNFRSRVRRAGITRSYGDQARSGVPMGALRAVCCHV